MTREEAKQNLIKLRDKLIEWYGINNDGLEIFRLAIVALEQPEIIYCDNCRYMQQDKIFHDCWCTVTGKKVWITHYCGYGKARASLEDDEE